MCCGGSFGNACIHTLCAPPCLHVVNDPWQDIKYLCVFVAYISCCFSFPTCCRDSTVDSSCCRFDSSSSHLQHRAQRWVSYRRAFVPRGHTTG